VVEKKNFPSPKEDSVTDLGHAGTKLFPGENSATDLGLNDWYYTLAYHNFSRDGKYPTSDRN